LSEAGVVVELERHRFASKPALVVMNIFQGRLVHEVARSDGTTIDKGSDDNNSDPNSITRSDVSNCPEADMPEPGRKRDSLSKFVPTRSSYEECCVDGT
jgi:hypothetical protein